MKKYNHGYDFVSDLVKEYGFLEGYRIAKNYLEMQKNNTNKEEKKFCDQIEMALWKLDQI